MDKHTHEIRCQQWKLIIEECLASGMSKRAWCEANGVSDKQFYYWQRVLRREAYLDMQSSQKSLPDKVPSTSSFIELKQPPVEQPLNGGSETFRPDVIVRSGDFVVEISNSASDNLLKRLGGLFYAQ